MASIVAYIEVREGVMTNPSRFVVAEARRVADAAGATVYALLTLGSLSQVEIDRLAAQVSAAGADRILCSSDETFAGPPLDVTHGVLLAEIAERLRPLIFLFPAGGVGIELAPPLAVRIGASYFPSASIDVHPEDRGPEAASQRVVLHRWRAARDGQRRIDVADVERPVVATLAAGTVPRPLGEAWAEVEMLPCPEPKFARPGYLASANAADDSDVELCSAMVWTAGPVNPAIRSALRAALPPGAVLVVEEEAKPVSLHGASPNEIFVLSSAAKGDDSLPSLSSLAPGATVTRVDVPGEASSAAMEGLMAAIDRARSTRTKVSS
jgi:hypothetical protein